MTPPLRGADRILELLYDRGGFVDRGELAACAGVPFGRVAKMVDELAQRGHQLEASPLQGVRLVRPAMLDAHLVERNLPVRHIGKHVICFEEVDSTNDLAFTSAVQAAGQALVVTAQSQRAGRGRLGRKWVSPPGSGLLVSVLLHAAARQLPHEPLTIAAGLAVAEGTQQATGAACRLKWPNDVLLGGRKLAGVLVEIRDVSGPQRVIGFGVNLTAVPPAEQVRQRVTCLSEHVSGPVEPIEVLRAILARLDEWVERLGGSDLSALQAAWLSRCDMLNQRLAVQTAATGRPERLVGRVLDVSPLEGLLLVTDDGRQHHLPAAVTSVLEDGIP